MVSQKEIIEALLNPPGWVSAESLANRIEAEGIAPPDGMVLMPSEPTENQLFHGYKARAETRLGEVRSIYMAMLAAAPKGVSDEQ